MEDVVLHYQAGSADGLSSLLERTEKLLEPFPCRTPPVFSPWFPNTASDHRRPIRPFKRAPVITFLEHSPVPDSRIHAHTTALSVLPGNWQHKPTVNGFVAKRRFDHRLSDALRHSPKKTERGDDGCCISETPNHLLPPSLCGKPERGGSRPSPDKLPRKDKDGLTVTPSPLRRCWSVSTQSRVLLQSCQTLSKQFHHVVSVHRLHLRQRVKWVISEDNCGAVRDIEQLWQTLSRFVRSTGLPTCNANIQRDRAEIWVFCDVLCSEQVGRFLKDELQLLGRIVLSVPRLGNVFSM